MSHITEIIHPEIDRRVRVFRFESEVDAYAIVTQRFVILVDTFATPELALELVQAVQAELSGRQLLVINTHADWDHFWGNAVFASDGSHPAPIISHEKMPARMRSESAKQYYQEQQRIDQRFQNVRLIEPNLTFSDRFQIDGGDLTIELIPTPGHTDDHLCIWISELRLLLAADAIELPIPEVESDESLPALRQSFERLKQLDAQCILPSHGGTISPDLLERNIQYFNQLEETVRQAISEHKVPPDWKERQDLPEQIGFPFELVVPINVSTPSEEKSPFGVTFYQQCHLKAVHATVAGMLLKQEKNCSL
jgi:glyoxylase-like metal-dependent hydrolase (beta-lactamase superfamily II)